MVPRYSEEDIRYMKYKIAYFKILDSLAGTQGAALLITSVFFLFISLGIVGAFVFPATKDYAQAALSDRSLQSYYTAESGLEDAVYRLIEGYVPASGEDLTVGEGEVEITITDLGGGAKRIVAEGDVDNAIRRVSVETQTGGVGASFHYGLQVGTGGIHMKNNAFVEGNVYSNGNLTGNNGAYVTGSGVAAGGLIDNLDIGTTGADEAWANDVTNSTMSGLLYCQTGSGNNKPCDTSRADPEPQSFPVTQVMIDGWKASAVAGGTILGDYTVDSDTTTSLGPVKITGNLEFDNNATLNMTGTIWVVGDVTTGNNSIVRLSSSYGANSDVLVTDGTVALSNNTNFYGSGTEGSYIMLLTTSSDAEAIDVTNNAGTVILNAQNGGLKFSNNSGAKQATSNSMILDNNAFVIYETGLVDVNFTSGPSGGYTITSWKEIE
jgi:hypothetical protein